MKPKLIAILAAAILLLILVIQNSQAVTVRVLFWQLSMSGILLFPLIFIVGAISGAAIFYFLKRNS